MRPAEVTPSDVNDFGQPVGAAVLDWSARPAPPRVTLDGHYCRLEPLDASRHGDDLLQVFAETDDSSWTYLPYGPFDSERQFRQWLDLVTHSDSAFFAVLDRRSEMAQGVLALMRADTTNGAVEVGNIHFSDAMKRTRLATEAVFLVMRQVFDRLGYRRLEWKCNALNASSRRAAQRFGFRPEGVFRQAVVVKGRNRDTAWFSVIDSEWPALRDAFEAWLATANFDTQGQQQASLAELIAAKRGA